MLCVFLQMTVNVHANIMQRSNGQPLSQPELSRPKGSYKGERLKLLRPQAYRRVVELLAEPGEHRGSFHNRVGQNFRDSATNTKLNHKAEGRIARISDTFSNPFSPPG